MHRHKYLVVMDAAIVLLATGIGLIAAGAAQPNNLPKPTSSFERLTKLNADQLLKQGTDIFRFDTFGDEAFWGDTLGLHKAIEGSAFIGGVGAGVSPATALAVGLRVDVDALPQKLIEELQGGIQTGKVFFEVKSFTYRTGLMGKLFSRWNHRAGLRGFRVARPTPRCS